MPRKSRRGSSRSDAKQRVRTARGRPNASTRWLQRQLNDPYVQEARRRGFRSRAAFKLIFIDDKYKLIRRNLRVVDLGAAPGSWSQVVLNKIDRQGLLVALDLLEVEPIMGVKTLIGNFLEKETQEKLLQIIGGTADLVLSDLGASATGNAVTDHLRSIVLAEAAFEFSTEILNEGGSFVVKLLQGVEENDYVMALRKQFAKVNRVKPPASRDRSAEMYVVARGFGRPKIL